MFGETINRLRVLVVVVGLTTAWGCANTLTGSAMVDTRALAEASGSPLISDISDLGGGDVLLEGNIDSSTGDGTVVIGETLWIRGREFGRQPTVQIAGRPVAVLARTADQGILVRVPAGCESGSQILSVTTRGGQAERPIVIQRYAVLLVPGAGQLDWLQVDRKGPGTKVVSTSAPDAAFLAMSHDGRAAYVTGVSGPVLTVFDVARAGGPRDVFRLEIGAAPVRFLMAADQAPLVAIVREQDVLLFDSSSAVRPARRQPRLLPPSVVRGRPVAAALSPDGRLLALALTEGNRVIVLDTERIKRGIDPIVADVPIEPDAQAPVLIDTSFAVDGGTLWVLAGETRESAGLGPLPTRIHALRILGPANSPQLLNARTIEVEETVVPLRIVAARASSLASGSAVRVPPERTPIYFSAVAHAQSGGPAASMILTVDGEDRASELAQSRGHIGSMASDPEGRWLLWAMRGQSGQVEIDAARVDGRDGNVDAWNIPGRVATAPGPMFLVTQP